MRNFNPFFNSINMTRNAYPFATAGSSFASRGIANGLFTRTAGSKLTLSSLLNGAQKTIGTVNQIVPLYNQVKPMFQNSKVLLNVAKGLRNSNLKPINRTKTNWNTENVSNTIDVKEEPIIKEKKEESFSNYSKPFFL